MPAKNFLSQGLSAKQVEASLKKNGFNDLPSKENRGFFGILLDIFKEPMILLLLAAGIAYVLLGERAEAILMMGSILFVIGLELAQENKTEKTLRALKDLSSPQALVIRDGKQQKIPGREVVEGDLVILREGDRIPADALILQASNFSVNEAMLTGESLPVAKISNKDKVYAGTLSVGGRALARVEKLAFKRKWEKSACL